MKCMYGIKTDFEFGMCACVFKSLYVLNQAFDIKPGISKELKNAVNSEENEEWISNVFS